MGRRLRECIRKTEAELLAQKDLSEPHEGFRKTKMAVEKLRRALAPEINLERI